MLLGSTFSNDFSTKANSPQAGTIGDPFISTSLGVADSGHIWTGSGAHLPGIKNGLMIQNDDGSGGGYGFVDLGRAPAQQSVTLQFGNSTGTVVSCSRVSFGSLYDMVHIQITPTGYNFQVREFAGSFVSIDTYTYAVSFAGTSTPQTATVVYDKDRATVTLCDGTVRRVRDRRLGTVVGRFLMYQALSTAAQGGGLIRVSAIPRGRQMA